MAEDGRGQRIEGFGTAVFAAQDGTTPGIAEALGDPLRSDFYDYDRFADVLVNDFNASFLRIELSHQALTNPRTLADGSPNPTFNQTANDPNLSPRLGLDYTTPVTLQSGTTRATAEANADLFDFDALRIRTGVRAATAVRAQSEDVRVIGSIWTPPHWLKGPDANFDAQPDSAPAGSQPFGAYSPAGAVPREGNEPPVFGGFADADSGLGSLRGDAESLTQFGEYVAAYVVGLERDAGIRLDAISIQNEPGNRAPLSHLLENPTLYAQALVAVDDAFTRYGIETDLIGPESIGIASVERGGFGTRQGLSDGNLIRQGEIIEAVWEAERALGRQLFDGFAVHGSDGLDRRSLRGDVTIDFAEGWDYYLNGIGQQPEGLTGPRFGPDADALTVDRQSFDGILNDPNRDLGGERFNWQTENSGVEHFWTSPTGLDNVDGTAYRPGALDQAVSLHHALVDGDVSAYLFWQLTSQTAGGLADDGSNRPADVAVLLVTDENQEYDLNQKKFAAAQHYTRFANAGMTRFDLTFTAGSEATVGTDLANDDDLLFQGEILGSLFVDEDTLDVSLVFANTYATEQLVEVDLAGLDGLVDGWVASLGDFTGVFTDADSTFALLGVDELSLDGSILSFTLGAESLTSITNNASFVPEPGSLAALAGLGGVLLRRRRIR